jgi:hypothetical protein
MGDFMADEKTPAPAPAPPPVWLADLVAVIEAIWAAMSASVSEPNHAVTQKLAAFKKSAGITK